MTPQAIEGSTSGFRPQLVVAILAAICILTLAIETHRLRSASAQVDDSLTSLQTLKRDADDVVKLRSLHEQVAWKQRPAADLLASVNRALADAGIPSSNLDGIGEGSDVVVSRGTTLDSSKAGRTALPLHKQTMTIRLRGISVAQAGQFMDHWRSVVQDNWHASHLELSHAGSMNPSDKDSDLYNLRMQIDTMYVAVE